MKRAQKRPGLQMNLRLLDPPAAIVPGDKQEELTQALIELLIDAAQNNKAESEEERNESETHA